MIPTIRYSKGSASPRLDQIRSRSLAASPELVRRVTEIVEGVRTGGDEALIHYTEKFDGVVLKPASLRVEPEFISRAASRADRAALEAFRRAIRNVTQFHERQKESNWEITNPDGARVGQRIVPVSSAGLYVPGGTAAYPSSVIMNAVPARVAEVPRIVVATPPGMLDRSPMIAAILAELGIDEVYRIGGAQAIAALAFGTESIPRVDKIVGPGNAYVAIAKKLVFGSVGIDSIAGPTEVVVLADDSANPAFVAADMLAQAEHDEAASAICITTSSDLASAIATEIEAQLARLERQSIAAKSIEHYGAIFLVESIEAGCDLVNLIAPEHLELMTNDNEAAAALVVNAGAIFFGDWTPEPVGDYLAGPNHVLPTLATSRFSSALGVYDFVKRQSTIRYTKKAMENTGGTIAAMANAEGLTAHRWAVLIRADCDPETE